MYMSRKEAVPNRRSFLAFLGSSCLVGQLVFPTSTPQSFSSEQSQSSPKQNEDETSHIDVRLKTSIYLLPIKHNNKQHLRPIISSTSIVIQHQVSIIQSTKRMGHLGEELDYLPNTKKYKLPTCYRNSGSDGDHNPNPFKGASCVTLATHQYNNLVVACELP